jgi:hypothetical protein
MATQYSWFGSQGPFKWDDAQDIPDPNGYMPAGTKQNSVVSTAPFVTTAIPSGDYDSVRLTDLKASEAFSFFLGGLSG